MFFHAEPDASDIEAVQGFVNAVLSEAGKQTILNAREIIEHDRLQDDKDLILRVREGLVDVHVEYTSEDTRKPIEEYMRKLDGFLAAIAKKGEEGKEKGEWRTGGGPSRGGASQVAPLTSL